MTTYTVDQVAESLQVSAESVLAMIRRGELAASNVGHGTRRPRWRITAEAIAAYLERTQFRAAKKTNARKRKKVTDYFADLETS